MEKLPITKIGRFLRSFFDLNQTCKIVLTQNHWFWNLYATGLPFIFFKNWRKSLKLWKMWKSWSLKKIGTSYEPKFVYPDNRGNQTKLNRTTKLWYLLCFAFPLLLRKIYLWNRDWVLGYISAQIWDFFNLRGNSFMKFLILDIKFNYICGAQGLH